MNATNGSAEGGEVEDRRGLAQQIPAGILRWAGKLLWFEIQHPVAVPVVGRGLAGVNRMRWDDENAAGWCEVTLAVKIERGRADIDQGDRERIVDVRRVAMIDERGVQRLDPRQPGRTDEPRRLGRALVNAATTSKTRRFRTGMHTGCRRYRY